MYNVQTTVSPYTNYNPARITNSFVEDRMSMTCMDKNTVSHKFFLGNEFISTICEYYNGNHRKLKKQRIFFFENYEKNTKTTENINGPCLASIYLIINFLSAYFCHTLLYLYHKRSWKSPHPSKEIWCQLLYLVRSKASFCF